MNQIVFATTLFIALGATTLRSQAGADEPVKPNDPSLSEASMAEKFTAIKAEYDAAMDRFRQAVEKIEDEAEFEKIYQTMAPDDVIFSHRMVELALTAPTTTASRDACLWVINHPGRSEAGKFADEYARAVALLVRHHGDDPEAIRIGLGLDNTFSFQRDQLLYGFLATAKTRESMGLARLSLAQYLAAKARYAQGTRNTKVRPKYKRAGKEHEQPIEQYTYILALRQCDPEKIKAEAERLFEEVASDYSDLPFMSIRMRELEKLMKEPNPTLGGKPITDDARRQISAILGTKKTLGQAAEARLDEIRNLSVGKPAPAIDGVDFDGKPLKLSDYRGKVVLLVFWGTWCGPCMAQVPQERDLVERLKGKPFALLGVNTDGNKEEAIKVMKSERITWPNWNDGDPGTGPITQRYHIRGFPSVLLIDADGIIRNKDLHGEAIDKAVDQLLEESAKKTESKP